MIKNNQFTTEKLVTPVYVDTNALLDVLASIENGFSFVEKLSTHSTRSAETKTSIKADAGTEFGIPNVLSMLKIKLGGDLARTSSGGSDQQSETERYHTYGSLLYRLREALLVHSLVKTTEQVIQEWQQIQPGDFLELRGRFRPNPFTDSLTGIDRAANLFELVANAQKSITPSGKTKSAQGNQQALQIDKAQLDAIKAVRIFFQGIVKEAERGDIRVVVVDLKSAPKHKAVASVFLEYLRDATMVELAWREYRTLARVVGKIEQSDPGIDLIRDTGLGIIDDAQISQLTTSLQIGNLPQLETKIAGPALQILPIAIYV